MTDKSYYIFVDSDKRATGNVNNFTYRMTPNNYIKNKCKIQLIELDFPSGLCPTSITSKNNKLSGYVTYNQVNFLFTITMDIGHYTNIDLAVVLARKLNEYLVTLTVPDVAVVFDGLSQKMSFQIISNNYLGTITLTPSTLSKTFGLPTDSNFTFSTTKTWAPYLAQRRFDQYYYLLCNQIQSSNFTANIGGNRILCKIRNTALSQNYIYMNNGDSDYYNFTIDNLGNELSFSVVDKEGSFIEIDNGFQYSMVLKITPID